MEELEFYFLVENRSLNCINDFLDKYAPDREQLSGSYPYPEIGNTPKFEFSNPDELMVKLIEDENQPYSIYWQVNNSCLNQVMVIFLEDSGLILGGVFDDNRRDILKEVATSISSENYYVSVEEHPPSTTKDFLSLCAKYRRNFSIDFSTNEDNNH